MKIDLKFILDENIILSRILINEIWNAYDNKQKSISSEIQEIIELIRKDEQHFDNYKSIKKQLYKIQLIFYKCSNERYSLREIFKNKIQNGDRVYKLLEIYKETQFFKNTIEETEKYLKKLEENWNNYLYMIEDYLEMITKSKIHNIKGKIYVIPNKYNSGESRLGAIDAEIIYGGMTKDRKLELDIVFLVHELLHNPILKYDNLNSINEIEKLHVIIQYIAEKELYYRMTKIPYFKNNNTYEKHKKLMLELYPYWIGYLYKDSINSLDDIRRALKREGMTIYNPKKIYDFFKQEKIETPYDLIYIDTSKYKEFYYV